MDGGNTVFCLECPVWRDGNQSEYEWSMARNRRWACEKFLQYGHQSDGGMAPQHETGAVDVTTFASPSSVVLGCFGYWWWWQRDNDRSGASTRACFNLSPLVDSFLYCWSRARTLYIHTVRDPRSVRSRASGEEDGLRVFLQLRSATWPLRSTVSNGPRFPKRALPNFFHGEGEGAVTCCGRVARPVCGVADESGFVPSGICTRVHQTNLIAKGAGRYDLQCELSELWCVPTLASIPCS
jgi:hypothetical protein